METAQRLLTTSGYHAVSLSAVASEAGVTRQAIYLHFKSKASLLEALVDDLNERFVFPAYQRSELWRMATGLEALDAWIEVVAQTTPSILAVANAVDTARRSDPEAEAIWQGPTRGRYADCLRIIRRLEDEGTLAAEWATADAARYLWATTSIRVFEDLTSRGWSRRRYVEHMRRSIRAALTTT